MNLLYDLIASQPNYEGMYHGGGKYAKVLFLKLVDSILVKKNIKLYVYYNCKLPVDNEIKNKFSKLTGLIDVSQNLPSAIKQYNIDTFYSALPYHIKEFKDLKCKKICTIHGLRELELPSTWESMKYQTLRNKIKTLGKIIFKNIYFRIHFNRFYELLNNDVQFITVSNHSRSTISSLFPKLKYNNIKVFYSPNICEKSFIINNTIINDAPFFLMVSGNRWGKNNLIGAKALDQFFSDNPDVNYKVIITGVSNKKIYINHLINTDRFIFLNYVNDEKLNELFSKAFALLYLSLNEGFGYPPLEAMRYSTPVIASPFTSIPEICGDSVLYANPNDILEIKNRINQIIFDNDLYNNLKSKSLIRYNYIKQIQEKHLIDLVEYILN